MCKHEFTVHPKGYTPSPGSGTWCIIRYRENSSGKVFSAKGSDLPNQPDMDVELIGTWEEDRKYGPTFQVLAHTIILPTSQSGVVAYLRSLKVGIGQAKAKRIYDRFQSKVWDVIENAPDELLDIPGITPKNVSRLKEKLAETRVDRELLKLFQGSFDASPAKLARIRRTLGTDAVELIRNDPYTLCQVPGFSFRIVDDFAKRQGVPPNAATRLEAGIRCVFQDAAARGHTCLPKPQFKIDLYRLLNRGYAPATVGEREIMDATNNAWKARKVSVSADMLYSRREYEREVSIAQTITHLLRQRSKPYDVNDIIKEFEVENGFQLADKQKDAIRSVFMHQVNIITGGPGSGKTTIIKAILYVYKKLFGEDTEPLLMAPTGRAARRMTEATGCEASTLHSALNWTPKKDRDDFDPSDLEEYAGSLDADLIIVDEFSMADMEITHLLMKRIPSKARVVFVGDADQLPSVGCGDVLRELIRSKKVPLVRLDVVFRQDEGSAILENAARIREGNSDLLRSKDFHIYEENNDIAVFDRACRLYQEKVQKYGIDNVILLCPYRKKTELNVNRFNAALQKMINPHQEMDINLGGDGKSRIYAKDRVMQMRNTDIASNGDIGVIHRIKRVADSENSGEWDIEAEVEFNGDGIIHPYSPIMATDLDLAYCSTVHKSQGGEWSSVILVLSDRHEMMLRRNIIYTAVTRAKKDMTVITEVVERDHYSYSPLRHAIHNDLKDHRYTLLADRINAAMEKLGGTIYV